MTNNRSWWMPVLIAFMLISNTFFVVDQREKAVVFQLRELVRTIDKPGLYVKVPFLQSVRRFDARILSLDRPAPENFLTGEKKSVEVDYYAKWRITDAAAYYRATTGNTEVATDLMNSIISRGLRDQFGSRTIQQVVADERDAVVAQVEKDVAAKVKRLGVEIVDVRIKSINLIKGVNNSVYDRMRAERARAAADLRARGAEEAEKIRATADSEAQVIVANAYKEAERLKGEGDAGAAAIYGRAYGQDPAFFSFYRSLGVYRDSFANSQSIMVMEPKGAFFRHFKGAP